MNYIIDPMWFYWIGVIDSLKILALALDIFCVIGAGISLAFWLDTCDDDYQKLSSRYGRAFVVGFAVLSLILVFVPSRSTLIEMMIARTATTQNAEMTLDAIKSAVDYVSNAIQSAK